MSSALPTAPVEYPDSDGKPIADNTLQFRLIVTLQGNIDLLFRTDPNVFVTGDLLWYPVEGSNTIRQGPDVLVAFGRPKGDRGSYRQWDEGGVPPQVVFEVTSPGNRRAEMKRKFDFYERYGVEEYYILDPDRIPLRGYVRGDAGLASVVRMDGWVSPRLGTRFGFGPDGPLLFHPDGSPFRTFLELGERAGIGVARATAEAARAAAVEARVERLAAKLREMGIDPGTILGMEGRVPVPRPRGRR